MSRRLSPLDADLTEEMPAASTDRPSPRSHRRRGWRRTVLISVVVLMVVVGGGLVAAGLYLRSIEQGVERIDAFDNVPEGSRPEKVASDAKNLLLLGSDSRDPENTAGSRSDTIILAHLPKDRSSAQLISIPRDTWLAIPPGKNSRGGEAKINAAMALGGVPLMVQTVESFTGVRIDHVALIDFGGFQEIVDALGGVDIEVDQNFKSIHEPYRTFTKGKRRMDGATALDYARQRQQFPDGDFTRIRHQQQMIRAVLDKAASGGLLANPAKLNSFLRATSDAVSVDQTLSIFDMASQLRHLRSGNLTFLTTPTKGTGRVGSESVVFADAERGKKLFDAVKRDSVPEIAAAAATTPK